MNDFKKVCVRIGSGKKVHPASIVTDEKGQHLRIICRCPGVANGHARNKATVVSDGWGNASCKIWTNALSRTEKQP